MAKEKTSEPVRLTGEISEPLSPALWLVKWLLIIPHLFVLCFLWIAAFFVGLAAFFAVLFTGHYPRGMFDFVVGVWRWTWRVSFYAYGALATDRYPPFTLKSTDYPADLQIEYPQRLKNGLALVKWFLAIPHYAVLAALIGGSWGSSAEAGPHGFGGLLWVLVLIVAVLLLFTGKYHKDIFRLVMGIHRWAYRVLAYVGLMTDEYPHFRLWE